MSTTDYISELNTIAMKERLTHRFETHASGPAHMPTWTVKLIVHRGSEYLGSYRSSGPDITRAKQNACQGFLSSRCPPVPVTVPASDVVPRSEHEQLLRATEMLYESRLEALRAQYNLLMDHYRDLLTKQPDKFTAKFVLPLGPLSLLVTVAHRGEGNLDLVGIEPNPGPFVTGTLWLPEVFNSPDLVTIDGNPVQWGRVQQGMREGQCYVTYKSILRALNLTSGTEAVHHFDRDDHLLIVTEGDVTSSSTFSVRKNRGRERRSPVAHFLRECDLVLERIADDVPAPFLVCVEPNPGPSVVYQPSLAELTLVTFGQTAPLSDVDAFRAVLADSHNAQMHALNGNLDFQQDHFLSGRNALSIPDKNVIMDATKGLALKYESRAWLNQSLDTFSDAPRDAVAFPRNTTDKVITQLITQTFNVGRPSTVPAGSNWAFHIIFNQSAGGVRTSNAGTIGFGGGMNGFTAQRHRVRGNLFMPDTALGGASTENSRPYASSPVLFHRVASGSATFNDADALANDFGVCDIPDDFVSDAIAIDSMGVEVVNTTNKLNISGSVTAYRAPAKIVEERMNYFATFGAGTGVQLNLAAGAPALFTNAQRTMTSTEVMLSQRPPNSLSEASLITNSATWDAAQGGYMNAVFQEPSVLERAKPRTTGWTLTDSLLGSDPNQVGSIMAVVPGVARNLGANLTMLQSFNPTRATTLEGAVVNNDFVTYAQPSQVIRVPVQRGGLYFEGLSDVTTLRVTVKIYVTRAPSIREGQLYTLAHSIPIDQPDLFELYAKVSQKLPAGVPFTANPLGEWALAAATILRKYGPQIWGATKGAIKGAINGWANKEVPKIEKAVEKKVERKDKPNKVAPKVSKPNKPTRPAPKPAQRANGQK